MNWLNLVLIGPRKKMELESLNLTNLDVTIQIWRANFLHFLLLKNSKY